MLRLWYDTKDRRLKIRKKKNFDYFVGGKSFYTFLEAPKKEEDKGMTKVVKSGYPYNFDLALDFKLKIYFESNFGHKMN